MDTMQKIALIVHTLIALAIIGLVLLQRGKGADAGAAFGAGASGTVFGARGSASFFSRATAVLATAFFVSSLTLAYLSSQRGSGPTSLLDDAPVVEAPREADAAPVTDEGLPESELPVLDTAVDSLDLPAFEDEVPAADDSQ
jgi:preprotein translocase subunit SecG